MELITFEFGRMSKIKNNFVFMLAALDSNAIWIRYWLHNFLFRNIISVKLHEFIKEVMESFNELKVSIN